MAGLLIIGLALVAALLWFLGNQEPRRLPLWNAAVFLLVADLVIVGLVVANYVAGGRP